MIIVGCDWSRSKHDLSIMDAKGAVMQQISIPHCTQAFATLAQDIAQLEPDPQQVHVGIELHDGALLSWLLDQGYTVFGMNPKSAQRARDRYRPSGSKDDKSDAFILADLVRTDAGYLRPMRPESDATEQLRCWVRLRTRLTKSKTTARQRLRTLLDEWSPAMSALCNDLDRRWQRDLLTEFPRHQDLCEAHGNRVNAFAKAHRMQQATRQRLDETRQLPPMPIPPARVEVIRFEILMLVDEIDRLIAQLADLDECLEALVAQHPDAVIFRSLPARGTATVATFLAAFGEDREGDRSWRELSARWGSSPVTVQSGRARHVKRRRACDHIINQAFLFFAFNTAFTKGCWAAEFYQSKRAQGASHYTTLRCLAQRWTKIIYRMWKDGSAYDEQHHQANRSRRAHSTS